MELLDVTLALMAEQHLRGNILAPLNGRAPCLKLLFVLLKNGRGCRNKKFGSEMRGGVGYINEKRRHKKWKTYLQRHVPHDASMVGARRRDHAILVIAPLNTRDWRAVKLKVGDWALPLKFT